MSSLILKYLCTFDSFYRQCSQAFFLFLSSVPIVKQNFWKCQSWLESSDEPTTLILPVYLIRSSDSYSRAATMPNTIKKEARTRHASANIRKDKLINQFSFIRLQSAMNRTESDYTQRGHLLIEILRRELAEFIKEISLKETHLQQSRLDLAARYNNSINQLFVQLDTNRKGYIDSTDLQIFLMNHKYYFQQQLIHKFVKKYSHNHLYLDVNEFYKLLLPRNRYEALSSSLRYKQFDGPCKKIAMELMLEDVSKLIKNELQVLKYFIEKKNQLIKFSLRNGSTLWRLIDKQFENTLTYDYAKKFLNYFKIDFTEIHWLAFLQYCTEVGKKSLSMREFLDVFNPEQYKRESFAIEMKKLEYPFEPHRVELEIQRDWRQQDWKKRTERIRVAQLQAAQGIVEQGKLLHKQYSKKDITRSMSTTGGDLKQKRDLLKSMTMNKSVLKSILKQEHMPVYDINHKRLMKYKDLGYRNTNNHIKAWI